MHLLFGARTADGLYDLAGLEKMAAGCPWLTVVPAVSHEPGFPGEQGMLHEVLVYRTHLRAYLETLLNNVEDWEESERSSLAAARAELPFPFPSVSPTPAPGQAPPPAPGAGPPSSPYSSPPSYTSQPSYSSPSPARLP